MLFGGGGLEGNFMFLELRWTVMISLFSYGELRDLGGAL